MRLPPGQHHIKATNCDRQDRLVIAFIKGDFMLCMRLYMHGPDDCLYTAYSYYGLVVQAWFECDAEP